MWSFFEFIFDFISFESFFGQTGRLIIKALTFGKVDLDLDRWAPCFFAVIVGLAFWVGLVGGALYWKFGYLIQHTINP